MGKQDSSLYHIIYSQRSYVPTSYKNKSFFRLENK